MKRVNFYYSTKLTFDDYVHDHSFALRIIPPETDTQKITSCGLNISPYVSTQQTVDAFGNNVTAGYLKGDHRFLDFEIKGTAETDCTKHRTDYMPCYLYQSQYTQPDESLKAFYDEIKGKCTGTVSDRARGFRAEKGRVSGLLAYTDISAQNGRNCGTLHRGTCLLRRGNSFMGRILDGRPLGGHRPRQQLPRQQRLPRYLAGQGFPRLRHRPRRDVRKEHTAAAIGALGADLTA